jgi:hypothetical protein
MKWKVIQRYSRVVVWCRGGVVLHGEAQWVNTDTREVRQQSHSTLYHIMNVFPQAFSSILYSP